ncbi:PD-(D/E)XK motif protein [Paenibacillus glufosinatiresistens]|uniref:PD-(D/E)XK motif protein n=1 Tax=Paenibacillus glufosinatiresistens TaxID=3070657 RepID=UPI00286E548A|nr:PD-(D/E)XK motif protein [Paenibacillus sp. YX.27]
MVTNEQLLDKWNSIIQYAKSYVRIDGTHPLDWHIGYEDINQKSLLIVCSYEPEILPSSKSIISSVGSRGDGKWTMTFRLVRQENEEVFIRLCCDLIESSRNQCDSVLGIKFVAKRYMQWSKLMEQESKGLLSDSERKGLLGELIHLQNCILDGIPMHEAVESWMGPEGADQDFVFSATWHEVKATGIGSESVSISSLEQLKAPCSGKLIIYFIDITAPNSSSSFTLLSKADDIRGVLKSNPATLDLFNDKLLGKGFIDSLEYKEYWYRLGGIQSYRVDDSFPKLINSNVPPQIASASYNISIPAIESWRIQ